MTRERCAALLTVIERLRTSDVPFALVHESALMGWEIDTSVFLGCADVLLFSDEEFGLLGCEMPLEIGKFAKTEIAGIPVRLWSRKSLGLSSPIEVTACQHYDCEALAPEIVLVKLPFSPDAPLLMEQRARLAAIVMADMLDDDELELVARYVRGE